MAPPLNDPMIRVYLLPWLRETYGSNLWIREEMGIHGCVADVVTISDQEIHIYEIKSDVDTTGRLGDRLKSGRGGRAWKRRGQVTAYSAMADRVTLVVGTELLEEALLMIPPWWGIVVALEEFPEVVMVPHREALPNPSLKWANVFQMLWRDEAETVCLRLGLVKGIKGASKATLKKRLQTTALSMDRLRWEIRRAIRERVWGEYKGRKRR